MSLQLDERQQGLSRSQVTNSLVIAGFAVFLMLLGLLMRNAALSASQPFLDETSGIRAQLPANWLINQEVPGFVLQAEDPGATPFKTALQVALLPVGLEATPRNVRDTLILQRSVTLSTFRHFSTTATTLRDQEALQVDYTYVHSENNPFLNAEPVVVRGRDVIVVRGRQALVITYLEERSRFEENERLFDTFLAGLQF